MRPTRRLVSVLGLFASTVLGCGSSTSEMGVVDAAPNDVGDGAGDVGDPTEFAVIPRSCGYDCPQKTDCSELKGAYVCPGLGAWNSIPHDSTCPAWDGVTVPTKVVGTCTATTPTGEAAKYTGIEGDLMILPDGRRVQPAGKEHAFSEDPSLTGGLPSAIIAIPGSRRVITVDTGYGAHVVRVIDVDLIGKKNPVLGIVRFDAPKTLNSGVSFVAPDRAYVATSDGVVQALTIDPVTGSLAKSDARSIKLPESKDRDGKPAVWHLASVATSPDGKRLIAGAVKERKLLVFDIDTGGAAYGSKLSEIDLLANETFAAAFDSHDPTGRTAYVTLWGFKEVLEIDLVGAKVARRFKTDKSPQALAFLDSRWMVVANAYGDSLSLIDRVANSVTKIPADVISGSHGLDPSGLAYDEKNKRLFVSLSGINALGVWDVDLSGGTPKVVPAGRLPTGWWPGGVAVLGDGSVAVPNMRGGFLAKDLKKWPINDGDVMGRTFGSIQFVPTPSASDLRAGETIVRVQNDVGLLPGAPKVECPAAAYDFPLPRDNKSGPSKQIQHVFFIVRENKTFDALLGDMPGVNGDPSLIMGKDKAMQDEVWPNLRALARDFAISDNYSTDAELSQQGHFWTVFGRSSDYNERTWAVDGYTRNTRGSPLPSGGVLDIGSPEEGSLFDWLGRGKIEYDILGEAMGLPTIKPPSGKNPVDTRYPGGFVQSMGYPDVEKACHIAARSRVLCDFGNFVYLTLPNDHTVGVSPREPAPDSMIAVNDEATGMLVEAITKSPLWPTSLIVITEDDPACGGEHVDVHRTPLVLISPWIKRGYVSKTHIDVSSLHKIFAHTFGLPYPNVQVEKAALPFDLFTSTPDFRSWDRKARKWPLRCGGAAPASEVILTDSFDVRDVDRNPELDRQVMRWMKGNPKTHLTEAELAEARMRIANKAAGLRADPTLPDDDD